MLELVPYMIREATAWIRSQREERRSAGVSLADRELTVLNPFFQEDTLRRVRVVQVPQIQNPGFYQDLSRMGQPIPLDFRQMAGITYIDTVLIAVGKTPSSKWHSLLFHECVHVAQYQILGVDMFAAQYVQGWADNGFRYDAIPLEQDAYQLQGRFERNNDTPFSVETEVAALLRSRDDSP